MSKQICIDHLYKQKDGVAELNITSDLAGGFGDLFQYVLLILPQQV